MQRKKFLPVIGAAFISLVLVGCSFLATTKEDMEAVDAEMASKADHGGAYEEYTPERFAELHGSEKFILFFHADWCPLCRALEAQIKKDLSVLNEHVVLEADYDEEVDLKVEYGVMIQTTVVFFNADGTVADKKINPRLSQIEEFLQ